MLANSNKGLNGSIKAMQRTGLRLSLSLGSFGLSHRSVNNSNRATVMISGEVVDPCCVIAGSCNRNGEQEIDVELDSAVVLHELQEWGINVTEDSLRDFVSTDSRTEPGREAYITFARFIVHPLTPLSGLRHTIVAKWAWVETTSVSLEDALVKFRGRCVPV
jgi:hypothetical protein